VLTANKRRPSIKVVVRIGYVFEIKGDRNGKDTLQT